MKRKELYAQIIKLNLQDKVKEVYGVNYTNCKNYELEDIIDKAKNKAKEPSKLQSGSCDSCDCCETANARKIKALVNVLKERHLLLPSDVEKIMNA